MLSVIVYEALKFFKDKVSSFIPPISDKLGEVFVIDDEDLSRMKACVANLDATKEFFIATYNLQVNDFPLKTTNIRVADIAKKIGKIYRVSPVNIQIQGNIITNDVVSALDLLNHLFLYKDTLYETIVMVNDVEIPIHLFIRPESFSLTAFSSLIRLPYLLDVYSLVFEKVGEGKLIEKIDFKLEL